MLYLSRDAGVSCDEVLHYDHSVAVYNYFATCGQDQSALNTPVTNLKYYGQSYDNLVTIITRWFKIEDIYGFRHIMSALAGWFAIMITSFFAIWLSGYGAGIIVILLFAVSPTYLGHSMNNLKDIPFALGYIASIFFSLRLFFRNSEMSKTDIFLVILSISFTISIRAGGLLLICYLFLFWLIYTLSRYYSEGRIDYKKTGKKLIIIVMISGAALMLSILLWPFALQDPVRNIFASYKVMAHFPGTFRQLFEGRAEWSDYMPWYYLLKSMAITIPLIVMAGIPFSVRLFRSDKGIIFGLLWFTLLFPMVFVIIERSNLYSSWRQFLFLYPVIVIITSAGIASLFDLIKNKVASLLLGAGIILLAIHPVKYIIMNHPFEYIYYNQLVGGLRGAGGNYETDYYYVGQTQASHWLIGYLEEKGIDSAIVKATYPVNWQFRNAPGIKTSYFRNEERSQHDWDYAIITNRYIPPYKLKNKMWPPDNTIHSVYADGVALCVVLERKSRNDLFGYIALEEGRFQDAVSHFKTALDDDDGDEMIFYNFARALYSSGEKEKADSVLKSGLNLNPDFELILMYLGNIAKSQGKNGIAAEYYEKLISVNRKYFAAYIELAGLYIENDLQKARKLLRTCLTINPGYKPAIVSLADTYRNTDPEIAEKYYKLAETTDK
jgi:hypothetical protein